MEGGPVQLSITEKLQTLKPQVVEVINESYMHNVPKGSETHFKVKRVLGLGGLSYSSTIKR